MNQISEQIPGATDALSAYMDGELPAAQRDGLLLALKTGHELRVDWTLYHCIGDVLRSSDTVSVRPLFATQIRARLDAEPYLFAPEVAKDFAAREMSLARRWRTPVAVSAGIAAVLVTGSALLFQRGPEVQQTASAPVASKAVSLAAAGSAGAPGATSATGEVTPVAEAAVRPVASEYLVAHGQYSSGLAMRGVVSHVRTAGYDGK